MNWYKIAKANIALHSEVTGYHHGQTDVTIIARDADTGKAVGSVEYVIFGNELTVSWVQVHPDYQRQGIATMMYDKMEEDNPGATYRRSGTTPEGNAFVENRQGYGQYI